jgi:hypothetical protein
MVAAMRDGFAFGFWFACGIAAALAIGTGIAFLLTLAVTLGRDALELWKLRRRARERDRLRAKLDGCP